MSYVALMGLIVGRRHNVGKFQNFDVLPQECMENTAQRACQEINTARGEGECSIYLEICPQVL